MSDERSSGSRVTFLGKSRMDNSVLDNLPPEKQEQLAQLQQKLEGLELIPLLQNLMEQFELSVNQVAVSAGMDESALHKLLDGQHREFKAEQVDALLNDLEMLNKLRDPYEQSIWRRALRIAAFQHFDFYKSVEPRLRTIQNPDEREKVLTEYLRQQYPALAETYDNTGGQFPAFVPLVDILSRNLLQRWGWIRIPAGYRLQRVEGDRYYLVSTDLFPKELTGLGPDVEVKDTGFGTYTVRRLPTPRIKRSEETHSKVTRFGDWIKIPAGKFLMGSKPENKLANDNEKPQHTVEIPYDYLIARTPVTNAQFREFVEATNRDLSGLKPDLTGLKDHPVVQVSWRDALSYCEWLTEKMRQSGELKSDEIVRLPTEAEWEKAARGEYGNEWPWGNEWDASKCNSSESKIGKTTPVGQYSPVGDSPYGVADMVGNVWEWCSSLYKPYPYQSDDGREDLKAEGSRVVRGGAFFSNRWGARASDRYNIHPYARYDRFGLRVVVSPGSRF
jgi:formylglycine-generating enzyme required for sulfatase activity